jgi:hypothetical protein
LSRLPHGTLHQPRNRPALLRRARVRVCVWVDAVGLQL